MKNRQILIFLFVYLLVLYSSFNINASSAFQINVPSASNGLRVVSYNIHFGMGSHGKSNIPEISNFLSFVQADIVCLQEVDKFSIRSLFTNQPEILSKYLSMKMVYEKTSTMISGETGNLILSKFPIIETEIIRLPSYKYPRNALKIIVDTPYGMMKVINTHLGLSKDIRLEQIHVLKKIIHNDHLPTVLAGDFNTTNTTELKDLFLLLQDPAVVTNKDHIHTFVNSKYSSRIDYILMPKGFHAGFYDVPDVKFSDHYPVIIDIHPQS